jgi:hypothetical protein
MTLRRFRDRLDPSERASAIGSTFDDHTLIAI